MLEHNDSQNISDIQKQRDTLNFLVLPASYMQQSWWLGPFSELKVTDSVSAKNRWLSLSKTISSALKLEDYEDDPWPFELQRLMLLPVNTLQPILVTLGGLAMAPNIATLVMADHVQAMKTVLGDARYRFFLLPENRRDMVFRSHLIQKNFNAPTSPKELNKSLEKAGAEVLAMLYCLLPRAFRSRVALKLPFKYAAFFKDNTYKLSGDEFTELHTIIEKLVDEVHSEWRE